MFDVKKVTNEIIEFIKNYYKENNLLGAVIGISGGKDSAVVAALFKEALGSKNVVGIWMPCHSKIEDKNNAILLANHLEIELKEFDLTETYNNYVKQIKENNEVEDTDLIDSNINIKPRLRMSTLYYYSAMLSKIKKGTYIVPGTSNKCELYVGYYTKGGDSVSDIRVISDLSVDEVIKVGEYLGLPEKVIHKAPDDGLSDKTDEEKLGVTYSDIEEVINNPLNPNVSEKTYKKIKKLHQNNLHKCNIATYLINKK